MASTGGQGDYGVEMDGDRGRGPAEYSDRPLGHFGAAPQRSSSSAFSASGQCPPASWIASR